MTIRVNIAEAKAKLSELVARAEAGEEVIIARSGKAAVTLRPVEPPPSRLGALSHLGVMEDPNLFFHPDPELETAAYGPLFPEEPVPPDTKT